MTPAPKLVATTCCLCGYVETVGTVRWACFDLHRVCPDCARQGVANGTLERLDEDDYRSAEECLQCQAQAHEDEAREASVQAVNDRLTGRTL